MTVIDTKPAAAPIRFCRWAWGSLAAFWCDAIPFVRREFEAWRRRRA